MSEIVRCVICGGLYNRSRLASHKRLSHREKKAAPDPSTTGEPNSVERILSLYKQLSNQSQKDLLDLLIKVTQET